MTNPRLQSTDTLSTLLQAGPAWCRVFTHDGFCLLDSRPTILLDRSIYGMGAARGGQPLPVAHRVYRLPDGFELTDDWQSHVKIETIPVDDHGLRDVFRVAQDFRRWYVLLHDYSIPDIAWLGVTAIGHSYRAWVGFDYFSMADLAALDAAR